jgi:hypothetical protein
MHCARIARHFGQFYHAFAKMIQVGLLRPQISRRKRLVLGADRVRRTRLYCIGTGKTGTHSIAAMFSRNVRSAHEPEALQLIEKIIARKEQRISEEELTQWLRVRDRKLALEVDSSALNFWILDLLLRKFPDARFVLTIRDCYSWCNSTMNHAARHAARFPEGVPPLWIQVWFLRFRPDLYQHAPEERLLQEKGFYSLDGYLSHWTRHNSEVIEKVPAGRLFVVRTDQIGEKALEIADFAGLPRRAVRLDRTHDFRNPSKEHILSQLDRAFVERKVEQHCRPLMTRFFPEIKSLDDVRL